MKRTLKEIILKSKEFISDDLTYEEIKWLLLDTFSLSDYQLITKQNVFFDDDEFFEKLNKAKKIPVSYILNYQYFCGDKYYVDNNVLIPRNETEELVLLAYDYIVKSNIKSVKILEIGTGSGCISIAINRKLNNAKKHNKIIACDISKKALQIAKKNAIDLNSNVEFIESDCLDNINEEFDFLISNPPYIKKGNYVSDRVLDNEPHIALFAEEDGLSIYKKIFRQINKNIKAMFFEISPDLVDGLEKMKNEYLSSFTSSYIKDMNGFVRFAIYINND